MSVQVEKLEGNMAKLTVEVDADAFAAAIEKVYQRQKGSISLPGFRKGKVPRQMVERMYGAGVFYEDAANELLQEHYPKAYDESGLDIVSQPEIDVVQIERGKPFIFTATVATKPEVTLGEYKGIEVTKAEITVTPEEIDADIERERNRNARTINAGRPAQMDDTANIDFEGFVDGVAFDGGKGENFDLKLGSHSFIDTFEDQLVGASDGDDVEVNVTFPENYQAAELAGKPALFKVHVNEIKTTELPELDDEFAKDVSEFDTMDEYRADVEKKIAERKENAAKSTRSEEAVQKLIERCEMTIPEPMIDSQVDTMMREFSQNIQQQGLTVEQYMQYTGMTRDALAAQMRPDAVRRIQSSLVLEAVAKDAAIEVTDEDLEEEFKKMAEAYGMELDQIKNIFGEEQRDSMKQDLAVQKAVDLILENAVDVEPAAEEPSEDAAEGEAVEDAE